MKSTKYTKKYILRDIIISLIEGRSLFNMTESFEHFLFGAESIRHHNFNRNAITLQGHERF